MIEIANAKENTGAQILAFIERIERLEEEKACIVEDVKEIKSEAKGFGLDVKAIAAIIKLRAMDKNKRDEEADILDCYKSAIGME
tara:strand:- start:74 stop:328 length:255 start_codon:yes stop_codon:yes gene_type:complete